MLCRIAGHFPQIGEYTSGQEVGADKVRRTVMGAFLVVAADITVLLALVRLVSLLIHHAAAVRTEQYAKRTWGKSFIKHYKEIGFLGPWVSFAHAVWLDEEDLQLIAESGAHLITNPSSNLRLRSGIFNMQRANELGIDCGIGLDGCAFDDDQDYLREIRVAWLNNLHNGVDGEVDYKDALKMATSRGAKISACGLSSGILEPGATADFTMISVDSIEKPYADPGIDPLALLVQRGTRQSVIMTCVNGKIAWQQNDESRKKEKDAEIQICTAIKELRAKDDGKRDNSIILQHVHDFYTKRK